MNTLITPIAPAGTGLPSRSWTVSASTLTEYTPSSPTSHPAPGGLIE